MRKLEKMTLELCNYLKEDIVGGTNILYHAMSFLCLDYAKRNLDLSEISFEQLINNSDPVQTLQHQFKVLESNADILHAVFDEFNYKSISRETVKKVAALFKGANLDNNELLSFNETLLSYGLDNIERETGIVYSQESIHRLMCELVFPSKGDVYDGVMGLADNFITALSENKYSMKNLHFYGQEKNLLISLVSKMRLFLYDVKECRIDCGDALVKPMLNEKDGLLRKFDAVVMTPPLGMSWKAIEKEIHDDLYSRYIFGTPSVSSSEWLYMSLAVSSLNITGKAAVLTTLGTLFRGGAEEKVRMNMINFDYIESIIQLPAGLLNNSSIPVAIMVFNKNKEQSMSRKIQLINVSEKFETAKRGRNVLSENVVDELLDLYNTKKQVEEFSRIVDSDELVDANLLPAKYIQSSIFNSTTFGKVRIQEEKMHYSKTLQDMGTFYRGINITSKYVQDESGNYKVINFADVKDGKLDLESVQTYSIENNARVEAYKVEAGDLIISNKGVTKICVVPEHQGNMLISQNFIGIRMKDGYNPKYIKEYLESPLGEYLLESRKTGTAIKMISVKDLQQLPIVENNILSQDEIMTEYEKKEIELKEELCIIQEKLNKLKCDLYDKMSLSVLIEKA